MLRELDATHPACIAVMPIPDHGLGEAINDRLRRAAAPREAARMSVSPDTLNTIEGSFRAEWLQRRCG